ncbi:type II toxin-antitoxin system death-on-curing family toxin, partial [Holdemanella biformis]
AINEKRIEVLNKTVSIQSRMLASTLGIEEKEVLNVIEAYSNALSLLDDYDHGTIPKPDGIASIYRLSYEECRELIDSMKYGNFSNVFGVEKEEGKLNGILAAIYQNVFGTELYPSIEEKAANLLYFLIKDHPFVDGCKRIGASIFLEFLNKNKHLIIDGKQIISDSALVAITLMIAESRPEEKETMVKLVMNFLNA